jgi:hypothetical protein
MQKKKNYLCCIFLSLWEKFHQISRKKFEKSSPYFNLACGLVAIFGIKKKQDTSSKNLSTFISNSLSWCLQLVQCLKKNNKHFVNCF